MSNHNNDDNNDDFTDGMIAAVVLGLATYGTVKLIQQVTKTPEQRVLDSIGREMRSIDASYADNEYDDDEVDDDED